MKENEILNFKFEIEDEEYMVAVNTCDEEKQEKFKFVESISAIESKTNKISSKMILINLSNYYYYKKDKVVRECGVYNDNGEIIEDIMRIYNIYIPRLVEMYKDGKEVEALEERPLLILATNKEAMDNILKNYDEDTKVAIKSHINAVMDKYS